MITIEQCRAARGLLGWTQQDLADASGLSKTAINNFEKGHSDIKHESLRAIRMAFESLNIEFLGQEGLKKSNEETYLLKGAAAFTKLLQQIQETNAEEDVLIINPASPETLAGHFKTGTPQNTRIICGRENMPLLGRLAECRSLEKAVLETAPGTYIFGTRVAFELSNEGMIIVVNSREAAAAERRRFEKLWATARDGNTHHNNNKAANLG
jgi:transcriptional regulator with XRE-family HTH domain